MKNNKTVNERKPDPEGIALWRDCCRYSTEDLLEERDFPEAFDFMSMWDDLGLRWAHVDPHPFKVGDRVILFRYYNEGITPATPGVGVQAVEVIDIGPSVLKVRDGDLSHFVASRELKGFKYVTLSPDQVVDLRSQGLITNIADLQHCKKLSREEWDQIVRILKLRQGQAEAEKQPNGKIRRGLKSDMTKARPSEPCH